MRLVEVIGTNHTSPETLALAKAWAARLPDKVVVTCGDTPGARSRCALASPAFNPLARLAMTSHARLASHA
jgi:3-hydroxyacyl-CoA dehydrogenase